MQNVTRNTLENMLCNTLKEYTTNPMLLLSPELNIVTINPAAAKVHGWKTKKALNKNYLTLCEKNH